MAKYTNLKDLFTAIADAIRAKTGSTGTIVADDFPSVISTIETDKTEDEDGIVDGSIRSYTNNRVEKLRAFLFCNAIHLSSVSCANVSSIQRSCFEECVSIQTVNFPSVTHVFDNAFMGCNELSSCVIPKCFRIDADAFAGTGALQELDVCNELSEKDFFLADIDLTAFEGSGIKRLIIRTPLGVVESRAANEPDIFLGYGTGYIYVPAALIDQYKAANNWSTFADRFRALEDYTVDGTITGELDESKI